MNAFDHNFALYEIAAKALIWKDDEILSLTFHDGGYDFPGGRMDKSEMQLEILDILARELAEELGTKIKYRIKDFAFISKRYYKRGEHNILALFFNVDHMSGEVELSDEHVDFSWVKPKELLSNPEKFVTEDEYKQYKKYIEARLGL